VPNTSSAPAAGRTGFMLRLFLPFALGFFLSMLYRTVNSVLAPGLIAEFKLTATDLGLMTGCYFIAFGAAQYPLGVALDRFGARRTLSFLLLFASLGALTFARAQSVAWLMVGRGLIGFGVAGCLMAALKAYNDHLPPEKLPFIQGLQMFAGALGVIASTKPVYFALAYTDWRGVFVILAAVTGMTALLVFFVVPRSRPEGNPAQSLSKQLWGALEVGSTARFWRLAPAASTAQASYLAIYTLWIGPWLRDVAGLPPRTVANYLLVISIGMAAGCIGNGIAADLLRPYGVTTVGVAFAGMASFAITIGLIAVFHRSGGALFSLALWVVFSVLGTFSYLSFPVFFSMFDRELGGRVITLYNFLIFVISFSLQWAIGAIVNRWPAVGANYNPAGYRVALLIIFVLNAATLVWLLLFRTGKLTFIAREESRREQMAQQQ